MSRSKNRFSQRTQRSQEFRTNPIWSEFHRPTAGCHGSPAQFAGDPWQCASPLPQPLPFLIFLVSAVFTLRTIIALVLLTSALTAHAQDTTDPLSLLPAEYRAAVQTALTTAGENRPELLSAIRASPPEHRPGIAFLLANMPERDLQSLSAQFLLDNTALAYAARARAPWGRNLPDDLFLNDVLPYANLNERRDPWRKDFSQRFWPLVKDCQTPGQAAVLLNNKIFDLLHVKYHPTKRPKPDQSPAESIAAGYASCSGLSILLVDACRSAGIPARAVGTPSWVIRKGDANGNHGGNHTWVEIFDDHWRHLGASEPSALDQTWFNDNASKADPTHPENCIYAASFKRTGLSFPLVWDPTIHYVPAVDVTRTYTAPAK